MMNSPPKQKSPSQVAVGMPPPAKVAPAGEID
jgi:hypothetical protein